MSAWDDIQKRQQREREERQTCGSQAHEDAIAERDNLRAVLKDLLEERGYEAKLVQARAQLGAALWLLEHRATEIEEFHEIEGGRAVASTESTRRMQESDWAQTVKLLKLALTTLPPTPGHDSTEAETRAARGGPRFVEVDAYLCGICGLWRHTGPCVCDPRPF